ncbi:hypothetical protein LXM25_20250 [Dyadobacter sp. LJ53]|uniref:hypothetical protein n=1 Tax=Dyadobacter chenwenxiniae TaxID=2906456 RepID=UPI001F2114F7|nr:hypothetical protein [Dyadobacter chenwenxiniae]MCF0052412.1 hypothetical protein [Dyadobacter chenwenxiniae]
MKEKGRFSISRKDKKSSKKSLDELKEDGRDQIDGGDVQGGWLQFGGGKMPDDEKDKK